MNTCILCHLNWTSRTNTVFERILRNQNFVFEHLRSFCFMPKSSIQVFVNFVQTNFHSAFNDIGCPWRGHRDTAFWEILFYYFFSFFQMQLEQIMEKIRCVELAYCERDLCNQRLAFNQLLFKRQTGQQLHIFSFKCLFFFQRVLGTSVIGWNNVQRRKMFCLMEKSTRAIT